MRSEDENVCTAPRLLLNPYQRPDSRLNLRQKKLWEDVWIHVGRRGGCWGITRSG